MVPDLAFPFDGGIRTVRSSGRGDMGTLQGRVWRGGGEVEKEKETIIFLNYLDSFLGEFALRTKKRKRPRPIVTRMTKVCIEVGGDRKITTFLKGNKFAQSSKLTIKKFKGPK